MVTHAARFALDEIGIDRLGPGSHQRHPLFRRSLKGPQRRHGFFNHPPLVAKRARRLGQDLLGDAIGAAGKPLAQLDDVADGKGHAEKLAALCAAINAAEPHLPFRRGHASARSLRRNRQPR